MKKIICPTDFSSVASNAVEYAVKLAKAINAELEIIHLEFLSPASPVYSGMEAAKNIASANALLKKMCVDINETYNVSCNYKVEAASDSIEYILSEQGSENELIVMGTNGRDDLYQYIFGTNTYHVIRNVKAPVLVIPEGTVYKPVTKIAFAWDYNCKYRASYEQVKNTFSVFKPEITLLHASTHKTEVSEDVYRAKKEDAYTCIGKDEKVSFARVHSASGDSEDIADAVDKYMAENDAELLAVTFYNRGKLRDIFHGAVIKALSEMAWYPLLIIHTDI